VIVALSISGLVPTFPTPRQEHMSSPTRAHCPITHVSQISLRKARGVSLFSVLHAIPTVATMFNWQNGMLLLLSYVIIPRLTFLPSSVHTLLVIFGPFLLNRLISAFNTSRAVSRSVPVRPPPPKVTRALKLLFVSTAVCLALSLPQFAPENVFARTESRLQIEAKVLFARLRQLRPRTDEDQALLDKFSVNPRNKLLYAQFGPDTLLNCIWCATNNGPDDTKNYFIYSIPKILAPHLAHLAVLGLATSSFIGPEGSRFRIHATIVGLFIVVAELYYLGTFDFAQNARAKTLREVEFVHWRLRMVRYIAFAAVDAMLGAVLWLTSTNRWLAKPPSMAERLESTTKQAEETVHKLRALGLLTNSINRQSALRGVREEYWRTEGQYMAAAVQEEEVSAEINKALMKLDMGMVEARTGEVADSIMSAIDGLRTSQSLAGSSMLESPS
jgi:hypothetical protein